MKFLITTDATAAEQLKKMGFQLIANGNGRWQFLNNEKLKFSHIKGVSPTNKIFGS